MGLAEQNIDLSVMTDVLLQGTRPIMLKYRPDVRGVSRMCMKPCNDR